MLTVSHHNHLVECGVRPCEHRICADRSARDAKLLVLSHRWNADSGEHHLLGLPPERLQSHDQSQPRGRRVFATMHDVSHHNLMAAGNFRSQQNSFSADRCAFCGALRELPRGRQVCRHADRLCVVPHDRFPEDHESESLHCRFPDNL